MSAVKDIKTNYPPEAIFQASRELALEKFKREADGLALSRPADCIEVLRSQFEGRDHECFIVAYLDSRHRVIKIIEEFHGTIDGACVYPRVVAANALALGAGAVVFAHNHPTGVSEPSLADQSITRRLKEALSMLEIRTLDHFVFGRPDEQPTSMAERGMI